MIINVPHFTQLNTIIEIDFSLFESFNVFTNGEINSNKFLLSLWHEFDNNFGTEAGTCPWAYFPNRYQLKKTLLSVLGLVDTTIGHFYVGITYQKKGDIDNIHFYSLNSKKNYKNIIEETVKKALQNQSKTVYYSITAEFKSIFKNLFFYNYSGTYFKFYNDNERQKITFNIKCIDEFEATQLTEKRLRTLTAFLSIETNIHFDYDNVLITLSETTEEPKEEVCKYQEEVFFNHTGEKGEDFLDDYPIYNSKLVISLMGVHFMNKYVFVEREFKNIQVVRNFLKACLHFHKGLGSETEMILPTSIISQEQVFALSPVGIFNKQAIINNSITFYLSSIEVISFYNSTSSTCITCNQEQYKIAQRVADFIKEYLNEDLSKVFKKLYNNRSKFLHTGESSSSNLSTSIKPIIDTSTASGLKDYGFITVNINGNCLGLYIANVREWTSLCFRKYYREKILLESG